ncbi:MAG TPA: class I SAM-dependent methyltransferase [Gemmatimonadaceae bacterium]|nr:class I SAM-dependent methyltransferase [Gemmatimonadaceae bacterium]
MPDPYISVEAEMAKIDGFLAPGRSFADMVRAYYVLTPESPPTLHQRYMAAMDAAVARGGGIISKLRQKFPAAGTGAMLDLGCGTGGMTIAGTRAYQTVVGVDVALRWLVMGKQRLEEAHIEAPLICANAESLPFKAEVFDAVVADSVLEHVRNSERMRDEALRVLMPGGAWFFVTNNRYSILPEPHLRLWGFGLLPRRVMEQLAWRLRATPYKARLHSRSELRRLFASYGEIMLPYYDPGELGPRNERIRQLWERLRKIGIVRYLGGAIVPQYFISGSRPPSRA